MRIIGLNMNYNESWQVVSLKNKSISFKFELGDYKEIGLHEFKEILHIKFLDPTVFVKKVNNSLSLSTKELFVDASNLIDPSKIISHFN
jgi:hypothetical protein